MLENAGRINGFTRYWNVSLESKGASSHYIIAKGIFFPVFHCLKPNSQRINQIKLLQKSLIRMLSIWVGTKSKSIRFRRQAILRTEYYFLWTILLSQWSWRPQYCTCENFSVLSSAHKGSKSVKYSHYMVAYDNKD